MRLHQKALYYALMDSHGVLYTRELPGGGYVAIEAMGEEPEVFRARVSVERRTDPERRMGHHPPVIAEASGESRTSVFNELYRIAADNVAVATGILRWQARHRPQS